MSNQIRQYKIEEFVIEAEPFYVSTSDEVEIFEAAYRQRIPVLLKGPTGTGKTRFVEYMAWKLGQPLTVVKNKGKRNSDGAHAGGSVPLVTVACHEDLTASDLIGRFLLDANGAVVSKDIPRILGAIKCGPELKGQPLPKDYNSAVMRVQRQFAEEVKHRQAERTHTCP